MKLVVTFIPITNNHQLSPYYSNCKAFLDNDQMNDVKDFILKIDGQANNVILSPIYDFYMGPTPMPAQDLKVLWSYYNRDTEKQNQIENNMLIDYLKIKGYLFMN